MYPCCCHKPQRADNFPIMQQYNLRLRENPNAAPEDPPPTELSLIKLLVFVLLRHARISFPVGWEKLLQCSLVKRKPTRRPRKIKSSARVEGERADAIHSPSQTRGGLRHWRYKIRQDGTFQRSVLPRDDSSSDLSHGKKPPTKPRLVLGLRVFFPPRSFRAVVFHPGKR